MSLFFVQRMFSACKRACFLYNAYFQLANKLVFCTTLVFNIFIQKNLNLYPKKSPQRIAGGEVANFIYKKI